MGLYKNLGEPDYIDNNGFDTRYPEVPGKILYGMNMAFNASLRSKDQSTKFGCFITDKDGGTIVSGYNSPTSGLNDEDIPQTRPEKYDWFVHAERAAINFAAKKGESLKGGIVYVGGIPCKDCMLALLDVEVDTIFYGPITSNMCEKESQYKYDLYKKWFEHKKTKLIKFRYLEGLFKLNPKFKNKIRGTVDINWDFNT